MTKTSTSKREYGVKGQTLRENKERLLELYQGAGTFRALGKALGVDHTHIWLYINEGRIPTRKRDRDRLGIVLPPSKGAIRYQRLNEKAKAMGWASWSEYCRAVAQGFVNVDPPDEETLERLG